MLHTHIPIQSLYDQQQHINLTAIRSLWKTFFHVHVQIYTLCVLHWSLCCGGRLWRRCGEWRVWRRWADQRTCLWRLRCRLLLLLLWRSQEARLSGECKIFSDEQFIDWAGKSFLALWVGQHTYTHLINGPYIYISYIQNVKGAYKKFMYMYSLISNTKRKCSCTRLPHSLPLTPGADF